MTLYRLDIKWTGKYGDTDPETGEPEITVRPDPDHPGTYIYSWTVHRATMLADEINGTITESLNGIATYVFNIYYGSDCWDCFFSARTSVRLWSEQEQKYIFEGRVVDVTDNMDADGLLYRTVECEDEMAYLCDSICDTQEVSRRLTELNRSMNARDVLVTMLEMHHLASQGIAGYTTKGFFPPSSTWNDETETFSYPTDAYPDTQIAQAFNGDVDTTWALIQEVFVDTLGMDIWITHDESIVDPEKGDDNWQFGYLVLNMGATGAHSKVGEPISVSSNMQSLRVESSPTSNGQITRIVPLGGIGADGKRLDVTSIDQPKEGWSDPIHDRAIANDILSITYGNIDKVSLHEDLVDNGNKSEAEVTAMIQELYRRGKAEADALSGGITSISVHAIDLARAGYQAEKFVVGDFHRITAEFFGLDDTFRLIRKETDLAEPWNPELVFAKSQTSSTNMTVRRQTNTSSRIYNVENMISTRLDKSAVMLTTAAAYAELAHKNETTVHYADQGDGTVKAYLGEKPIVSDGGGGYRVASAAILTSATAADFIINREIMIDYSPATKVYYGSSPSFFILNGNYVYFSNILIRDDSSGKNSVIAHSDYFGGGITLRGVAYDPALTDNEYNVVDITITTRIESMQYNSTNTTSPYMEDAGIYASGQYGDTPVSKINRFVLMQNMAYRQNGWVEDIMLVPRIGTIFQPTDENIKALLPEGVTFVMEVVLETLWKIGNTWSQNNYPPTISPYNIGWSTNNNSKFYVFFKDQAEQDFALGVTQRSEPVEVTT